MTPSEKTTPYTFTERPSNEIIKETTPALLGETTYDLETKTQPIISESLLLELVTTAYFTISDSLPSESETTLLALSETSPSEPENETATAI